MLLLSNLLSFSFPFLGIPGHVAEKKSAHRPTTLVGRPSHDIQKFMNFATMKKKLKSGIQIDFSPICQLFLFMQLTGKLGLATKASTKKNEHQTERKPKTL